jgi:hypothetical protein
MMSNTPTSVRKITPTVRSPKSETIRNGESVSAENPNTVVIPETVIALPTRWERVYESG